jgi:hypothetical protein
MSTRHSARVAFAVAAAIGLGGCATYDGYGNSTYGNSPYGSSSYGNAPSGYDPRYGSGSGRYGQGNRPGSSVILCESNDGRVARCAADTRGGVRLVQRESKAACVEGRSWGQDPRGIWVSNGCRARFEVGSAYVAPGRGRGSDRGGGIVVCESQNERRQLCAVPGNVRQVQLVRQLSDTQCRENANWGLQRGAIWVDRGCRAEFRVY